MNKKKGKGKVVKPVSKPKSRRGFSVSNILPNLKKAYNTLSPALNLPPLGLTKKVYNIYEATNRKLQNKVYKKSEKIPMRIWNSPSIPLYGDGSGRSFANNGYSACINEFDGRRPESWCHKEKTKQGLVLNDRTGWGKN